LSKDHKHVDEETHASSNGSGAGSDTSANSGTSASSTTETNGTSTAASGTSIPDWQITLLKKCVPGFVATPGPIVRTITEHLAGDVPADEVDELDAKQTPEEQAQEMLVRLLRTLQTCPISEPNRCLAIDAKGNPNPIYFRMINPIKDIDIVFYKQKKGKNQGQPSLMMQRKNCPGETTGNICVQTPFSATGTSHCTFKGSFASEKAREDTKKHKTDKYGRLMPYLYRYILRHRVDNTEAEYYQCWLECVTDRMITYIETHAPTIYSQELNSFMSYLDPPVDCHADMKVEAHIKLRYNIAVKFISPMVLQLPKVSFVNHKAKLEYLQKLAVNPGHPLPEERELKLGERGNQFPCYTQDGKRARRCGWLMLNGKRERLPKSITERLLEETWDPREGATIKYQKKLYSTMAEMSSGAFPLTPREKELLAKSAELREAMKQDQYVFRILDIYVKNVGVLKIEEQAVKQGDRAAVRTRLVPYMSGNGQGIVAWMESVLLEAPPGSCSKQANQDSIKYYASTGAIPETTTFSDVSGEAIDFRSEPSKQQQGQPQDFGSSVAIESILD
jgi:hypothetical protein